MRCLVPKDVKPAMPTVRRDGPCMVAACDRLLRLPPGEVVPLRRAFLGWLAERKGQLLPESAAAGKGDLAAVAPAGEGAAAAPPPPADKGEAVVRFRLSASASLSAKRADLAGNGAWMDASVTLEAEQPEAEQP